MFLGSTGLLREKQTFLFFNPLLFENFLTDCTAFYYAMLTLRGFLSLATKRVLTNTNDNRNLGSKERNCSEDSSAGMIGSVLDFVFCDVWTVLSFQNRGILRTVHRSANVQSGISQTHLTEWKHFSLLFY